jgi:hypothetical protein
MTIRDHIHRRVWRAAGVQLLSLPLVALAGPMKPGHGPDAFFLLALIPLFAGGLYIVLGIRCPKCNRRLGMAAAESAFSFLPLNQKLNHCPGCGVSMDSHVPGTK